MKHTLLLFGAASAMLLTGCIDDKYDLSDIDTTSEFKVNDLVIPVNLEPVILSDIIKVNEGDQLKEVTINGNTFYAVEQTGTFNSDGITINGFTATSDEMYDKTAKFRASNPAAARKRGAKASKTFSLEEPVTEDLTYTAEDIDGSVRSLDAINYKPLNFQIKITSKNLPSDVVSTLKDVSLFIPKGLTVVDIQAGGVTYPKSTYNGMTGELSFETLAFTGDFTTIDVTSNSIDLQLYDNAFSYDETKKSGEFSLISQINIQDCSLILEGEDSEMATMDEVEYTVHYELNTLDATSILGKIEYDLEGTGLEIEPISLENLPSFLDNDETNLILSNPQIYLQLSNPVGKYGLSYQSSLDILAQREGSEDVPFPSPLVKVPAAPGDFNFVLAPYPQDVTDIPEDYKANIEKLKYEGLGHILSGNGLPDMLDIELVKPMIPEQTVTTPFDLNNTIEGMSGSYQFLAPLSLAEGSQIVKTVDGWWSEDLADLNIDYLTITADATNGLSTGVIIKVYAIDNYGNRISSEASLKLDYNAQNDPIEFTLTGEDEKPFNNLDGIELYVMTSGGNNQPLAPDQVITLENLKAKVSGNYTRKL